MTPKQEKTVRKLLTAVDEAITLLFELVDKEEVTKEQMSTTLEIMVDAYEEAKHTVPTAL